MRSLEECVISENRRIFPLVLLLILLTVLPLTAFTALLRTPSGYAQPLLTWTKINLQPTQASGCGFPLSPICVRTAYGFTGVSASGTGVTIAIVDAFGDPTLTDDLASFDGKYGLAAPSLTVINVDGPPGTNSGWALETALDVEWAHAIAPNAAIRLYIGVDNSFQHLLNAINAAISDNIASVISMSFGASERSFSTSGFLTLYESAFSSAISKSITPVAASGDNGKVIYPSSSPSVLSVGGTTLTIMSDGTYVSESAWSSSGGGSSSIFPEPSYQMGVAVIDKTGKRGTPDVAYDADPATGFDVFCSFCGGEFQVGGTSAGAPQWSALLALSIQTKGPLGLVNGPIYIIGKGATYSSNFHDVTTGRVGGKAALVGWDFTTGWGSPKANNLVSNL